MENVTTWGQLAFYAVACGCGIVWAVGQLFKTMGTSYGAIIAALQTQNVGQQNQINDLTARVTQSDKDCDEKIKDLERHRQVNTSAISDVSQRVDALTVKVNGGSH